MTRGVVVDGLGEAPRLAEFALPQVGAGDVRVSIRAAGVCHSDLSLSNGTFSPAFPVVLGHEAAGVVTQVGSAAGSVAVGDHVIFNWSPGCGLCWFCARDQPWLCAEGRGDASRPAGMIGDTRLHAGLGIGALADEVVVPWGATVPMPDGLDFDIAALLGCAVLTGVGAVCNTAEVRPGESVVVFGVGGVGLSVLAGARWCGAGPVIAVDVGTDKSELAQSLGATNYLATGDDIAKQVRALTGGRGADHAFECVGSAATIRTAWSATRRGGQCVVVGVGRRDDPVSFTPMEIYYSNRRLLSSIYGSSVPAHDIPALAAEVLRGRLMLDGLITERVGLDEVPAAFERMLAGIGGRTVVMFE